MIGLDLDFSLARTVKMTLCDYQILEYTNSELRTHGVPFIVILRFHMQNSYVLTGYVLQNWRGKIGATSEGELDDVEDFLEDLQRHSRISPSSDTRFFDRLNGLGVGPLRAFVSGSCLVPELDTLLPMFFDGQVGLAGWQRSFDLVGENCFDLAEKLVPASITGSLPSDG
ncbi:hypothetical protein [Tunturiibacter psychrotolerans]|uniref:hypothetical protein n=1 Tax=Tunturiibacter psychrotolerans TaxID=3069686 RepID=UPI003D2098A4